MAVHNPTYTLTELLALPATAERYAAMLDLVYYAKTNADAIAAISVGSVVAFGHAYDSRYHWADTSASTTTYTATASPAPDITDTIPTGYRVTFLPATNNTAASTLNIATAEGAVTIKKYIDGALSDVAAGDLNTLTPALLVFDGTYWILINPVVVHTTSINTISKSGNYSIVAADLDDYDHLVVLVDASAASVTITLPAPSVYSGKSITVKADVDPAGYSCITNKSGATEFHTGYAKSDYIEVTSDGTNDIILSEDVTVYGVVSKSADETITASATTDPFDSTYVESQDVGGWWDAVTNHRLDIGFACELEMTYALVCRDSIIPNLKVNGIYLQDIIGAAAASNHKHHYDLRAASGLYFEFFVTNSAATGYVLSGDASYDESRVYWNVKKRIR